MAFSAAIIEIRLSKKFKGSWKAREAPGVEPAFPMREYAIDYARTRFGGSSGEIHVYDELDEYIIQTISIDGGTQYGSPVAEQE